MYFDDLTPYAYSEVRLADDAPTLLNFGWLEGGHEYPRSLPPAGLADCTLRLASKYQAGMRGFHTCTLCPHNGAQLWMPLDDKRIYLGSAEIRIRSGDVTYVAPNLLPHYIAEHGYRPPAKVLKALESYCDNPDSADRKKPSSRFRAILARLRR